jgi:hypothetical protein
MTLVVGCRIPCKLPPCTDLQLWGIICLPMSTKSDNIKATLQATRERRKSQTCHVYEIKVDKARLPASQRLSLAQLFREAKWFWNAALA